MNPDVDAYISQLESGWQREAVVKIRAAIHLSDPNIEEKIKWGTPAFEHAGPVVWVYCAKDWVQLAFIQGALLDDNHGLFIEGENTTNKAKRTIKLRSTDKVPEKALSKLVKQAVANNLAGKKVVFKIPRKGERRFDVPAEYENLLRDDGLLEAFNGRPYYQQKGWIQWIESAKQEATAQRRRQTMLQELRDGTYMPPKHDR